jgi:hypothetical protein
MKAISCSRRVCGVSVEEEKEKDETKAAAGRVERETEGSPWTTDNNPAWSFLMKSIHGVSLLYKQLLP